MPIRRSDYYRFIGSAVYAASLSVTVPLTSRVVTPETLGVLSGLIAGGNIIAILLGVGVPTVITSSAARSGISGVWTEVSRSNSLILKWLAPSLLIGALVLPPLTHSTRLAAIGAVLFGVSSALAQVRLGAVRGSSESRLFVTLAILLGLLPHLIGCLTAWVLSPSPWGYILGVLTGQVPILIWFSLWSPWSKAAKDKQSSRRRTKAEHDHCDPIRVGLPLMLNSLAAYGLYVSDRMVLLVVSGPLVAGEYFAAATLAAVPAGLVAATSTAWGPRIYERFGGESSDRHEQNLLRIFAVCFLVIWIPIVAPLRNLLFPAPYQTSTVLFVAIVLSLAAFIVLEAALPIHRMIKRGRTSRVGVAATISLCVNIPLTFIFAGVWNAEGAAVASLLSYLLYLLLVRLGRSE